MEQLKNRKPEWLTHEHVIATIEKTISEEHKGIKIFLIGNHEEIAEVEDLILDNYQGNQSLTCFASRSLGRTFRKSSKMQSVNYESSNNQSTAR